MRVDNLSMYVWNHDGSCGYMAGCVDMWMDRYISHTGAPQRKYHRYAGETGCFHTIHRPYYYCYCD
jgi:hypothetical protein